jgi:hypothetical protein
MVETETNRGMFDNVFSLPTLFKSYIHTLAITCRRLKPTRVIQSTKSKRLRKDL